MCIQIQSINTSNSESKGILQLKVEGTTEHLTITTPSISDADYIGQYQRHCMYCREIMWTEWWDNDTCGSGVAVVGLVVVLQLCGSRDSLHFWVGIWMLTAAFKISVFLVMISIIYYYINQIKRCLTVHWVLRAEASLLKAGAGLRIE